MTRLLTFLGQLPGENGLSLMESTDHVVSRFLHGPSMIFLGNTPPSRGVSLLARVGNRLQKEHVLPFITSDSSALNFFHNPLSDSPSYRPLLVPLARHGRHQVNVHLRRSL